MGVNQRAHGGIQYYGLNRKNVRRHVPGTRNTVSFRSLATSPSRDTSLDKLRAKISKSRSYVTQATPKPKRATVDRTSKPHPDSTKAKPPTSVGILILATIERANGQVRRAELLNEVVAEVMQRPDLRRQTRWDTHVFVGKALQRYLNSGHLMESDDFVFTRRAWKKHNRNNNRYYQSPALRITQAHEQPPRHEPRSRTVATLARSAPRPQPKAQQEEWKTTLAMLLN